MKSTSKAEGADGDIGCGPPPCGEKSHTKCVGTSADLTDRNKLLSSFLTLPMNNQLNLSSIRQRLVLRAILGKNCDPKWILLEVGGGHGPGPPPRF